MKRILSAALILSASAPSTLLAQSFQPSKMAASGKDSMEVVFQGQVLGYALFSYARVGDNYRIVSDANLPAAMVRQQDSVVFNATTLMPISFVTRGSIQGMAMTTDVTVVDGRAKGTAIKPTPTGPQTVNIDLAIPAGAMADGAELALIPTMDLTDGLTLNFKSADASTGEMKDTEMKVTGKETVTVPAGTFEAYRISLKSKEQVTIYVTTAAPRRIVLLRLDGQNIEMRLTK